MIKDEKNCPTCFGDLDTVFPKGDDGLRSTPESCYPCPHKTPCLRTAVSGPKGHKIRYEMIDRAYSSGRMSFWERWSKRKVLEYNIRQKNKRN